MNTIEQAEGMPINIDSAQIQIVHCRDTWCAHNVFTSNGVLHALVEAPTQSWIQTSHLEHMSYKYVKIMR